MPINDERLGNPDEISQIAQAAEEEREKIRNMSEEELMNVPIERLRGLPEVQVYYGSAVLHHQEETVLEANPHLQKIINVIERRKGE